MSAKSVEPFLISEVIDLDDATHLLRADLVSWMKENEHRIRHVRDVKLLKEIRNLPATISVSDQGIIFSSERASKIALELHIGSTRCPTFKIFNFLDSSLLKIVSDRLKILT